MRFACACAACACADASAGLGALHRRVVLRRVDLEQELALRDHLAFLHGEPHDAAGDVGGDVDLRARLHLAARRHRGDEVALLDRLDADFGRLVAAASRRLMPADRRRSTMTTPPTIDHFMLLLISVSRLAKGTADRALERGEGLVEFVDRVDAVGFRALVVVRAPA